MHTGVVHDLDLDSDGKRLTSLGLPFSVDRSPYFQVKVPVCNIRNGGGPSVLLMAGNHGDEYEGELSLARLIRRLEPARMRGRLRSTTLSSTSILVERRWSISFAR
jgi:predicted deacylase